MNLLTQYWLAVLCCLCFIYLTIGIAVLDYLDRKLYEIETRISRLKNLERLVRPDRIDFARAHQQWFLGGQDKILIPPSKKGLLYWVGLLMVAAPIGSFSLLLNFASLGDFPLIPQGFSFINLAIWPRTFSESIRQIQQSHSWYSENKPRVINRINEADQPA